jgi:DNA-binding NarL/FixJ family response regulator
MGGLAVALIVAQPGRIREAWRALLLARREIAVVHEVEDGLGALLLLDTHGADIVLIDTEAPGAEAEALVSHCRASQPGCRSIVLVRDEWQARELQHLPVDEVLVKGLPAALLFEAVDRVLARPARAPDNLQPT